MVLRSLYISKTQAGIRNLVKDQPDPELFFNFFLDLNGINLASILSYDSVSMEYILNDKFSHLFSDEYPLFYKVKIQRGGNLLTDDKDSFNYLNALDNAVYHDQPKSVTVIMDYLIKHQNDFTTHYLF